MAQESIFLLNKTVFGAGQNRAATPPDSISVRIEGLNPGGYLELYSVTWGIVGGTGGALDAFDFGPLLILRNEQFDPNFNYGVLNVADVKDVVWQDEIVRDILFNDRQFHTPMKLTEASNYLIIVPAPTDLATAATLYDTCLTVRGEIFNANTKSSNPSDSVR